MSFFLTQTQGEKHKLGITGVLILASLIFFGTGQLLTRTGPRSTLGGQPSIYCVRVD